MDRTFWNRTVLWEVYYIVYFFYYSNHCFDVIFCLQDKLTFAYLSSYKQASLVKEKTIH